MINPPSQKEELEYSRILRGRIEEQEAQINELKAQVQQLQNQVKIPATSDEAAAMAITGMRLENNDNSKLTEFHNKYVAEIKAQAVREFIKSTIEHFDGCNYNINRMTVNCYLNDQLRQQAG